MTLTLRIDNLDQLPDGGPVEHTTDGRGFEIGRDPGMDWTLPDPNRFVSSRHLEVRFEGGSYMVYDVSTNGTLLNGASMRMKSPHALQNGDRFQIGHYLVVATLMEAGTGLSPTGTAAPGMSNQPSNDIWSVPGAEAVPAFDPTPRSRERLPDFGDEKIDLPFGSGSGSSPFSSEPQPAEAPDPTPGPFVDDEADSPFGPGPSELPDLPGEPPAPPEVPLAPPSAEERAGSPFGAPEHTTPPPPVKQGGFGGPQEKTPEASPSAPPQPKTPPQDTAPPAEKPKTPVTEQPTGTARQPSPAAEAFKPLPKKPEAAKSTPPPPVSAGQANSNDVLKAICEGAGIDPATLNGTDPTETAHEIGQTLRVMAGELAGLLKARAATKQMVRSGSRTMIGPDDNNPLKFTPTATEALEIMFGPGKPGYLRGSAAVQTSFDDVKAHQYAVHAAIQPALARLLEDLSPEAVEDKIEGSRFSSKSAKCWEVFVERWDAKTHPYENGMLDVFLAYFSDAYDESVEGR